MGAIDLSELKNKKTEPSTADLTEEQRAALAEMAEQNPPEEGEHVATAFLVLVHTDGGVEIQPDLTAKVVREDIPNSAQIYQAAQTIAKDIQVQETAGFVAMQMQQMAMMAQQQLQNSQLAQHLNL